MKYDKPCKRCGECCKAEICMIGETVFGVVEPPCPALLKRDKIYYCGFVAIESEVDIQPLISRALGIGKGCDSEPIRLMATLMEGVRK